MQTNNEGEKTKRSFYVSVTQRGQLTLPVEAQRALKTKSLKKVMLTEVLPIVKTMMCRNISGPSYHCLRCLAESQSSFSLAHRDVLIAVRLS